MYFVIHLERFTYHHIYIYAYSAFHKVQFRQGFAYFNNNVDSKRHIIIRTAILYAYIYSLMYKDTHICMAQNHLADINTIMNEYKCINRNFQLHLRISSVVKNKY